MKISKLTFAALLLLASAPLALAQGTWTQIDYPGASSTGLFRINNTGQMVGFYYDANNVGHGFELSGGNYISIDFPGATSTAAFGINDSGQIVGDYFTDTWHGFLLEGQTFTKIDFPSAIATYPHAIDNNNGGQVVGVYTSSNDQDHGFFRVSNGSAYKTIEPHGASFAECNGIDNFSEIVGDSDNGSGILEGFVYNGSFVRKIHVPGASVTTAIGISDSKEIVGGFYPLYGSPEQGYRFGVGGYSLLNYPGAYSTEPWQSNLTGMIVGSFVDQSGVGHGFTWTPPADAAKK
jgi:hypothetical protein